ncbi:hypothetical protein BST81_04390 [Leptolyngbya sp. 'hensonii']|uniref:hypothetical protein n=1 Tax=Leptolyngbya sp. 'hensonii' TaxID=1922337 RepID=UPI00094FC29D|nr:hypothetical protein [Leptolyngbya sp. 'hensonii']OLP19777.1 hypothetical protein BST81_04390 [Leptolyngbya sp. 'hensonii']
MRFGYFSSAAVLTIVALGSAAPIVQAQTPEAAAAQIAALRTQGSSGLQTFLQTYAQQLNLPLGTLPQPEVRAALDSLCQQRDCHASRLYWYTDLEQAKAIAKAEGKPILSLRLLGRLDEELSCANSRFFRIILYPNAQVSQVLRERFVLHWQSVRPVPKVSIDFGDGRKLERTLTGNSIHYILDSAGRPIDALPGLYGPQAFLRQLQQAEQAVQEYGRRQGADRESFLQQYHRDRLAAIQTAWTADLKQAGITAVPKLAPLPEGVPTAEEASRVAVSKMVVEMPLLMRISLAAARNRTLLETVTDQAAWVKLAELHRDDARLDTSSRNLMRSKNPSLLAATKSVPASTADPFGALLSKFEAVIALDTVRNEYLLHNQIHQWFVEGQTTDQVETLNDRVYSQLFLTPSSDPWLGLLPADGYAAIENDGIRQ